MTHADSALALGKPPDRVESSVTGAQRYRFKIRYSWYERAEMPHLRYPEHTYSVAETSDDAVFAAQAMWSEAKNTSNGGPKLVGVAISEDGGEWVAYKPPARPVCADTPLYRAPQPGQTGHDWVLCTMQTGRGYHKCSRCGKLADRPWFPGDQQMEDQCAS